MRFVLTKEDRSSALWRKLMRHWEEKLASLRAQNDGDLTDANTLKLRGRIAELKANMALAKDLPEID